MRRQIKHADQRRLICPLEIVVGDAPCSVARDADSARIRTRWIHGHPAVLELAQVNMPGTGFDPPHFTERSAQMEVLRIELVEPVEAAGAPDREVPGGVLPARAIAR